MRVTTPGQSKIQQLVQTDRMRYCPVYQLVQTVAMPAPSGVIWPSQMSEREPESLGQEKLIVRMKELTQKVPSKRS